MSRSKLRLYTIFLAVGAFLAGTAPFAVRAQIIREPGDDVALSGGESPQPGSRDLFRALRSANEFLLPRDGMKLGFRRAGAKGANADAVRLHFLRQPLGK